MFAFGVIVGLAEGIIDDPCLVISVFIQTKIWVTTCGSLLIQAVVYNSNYKERSYVRIYIKISVCILTNYSTLLDEKWLTKMLKF